GLGLKVEPPARVAVKVGFDIQMGFGISRTDGFFFDTSAGDVPGKPAPELTINVQAGIPDLRASGQLGFLQLDLNDEDADNNPNNPGVDVNGNGVMPSSFNFTVAVDVKDPVGSNNRLTFQDLSSSGLNLGDVLTARLTGAADVNLNGRASFAGSAVFPSILTDFHLGWTFANVDTASNTFDFGGKPDVVFKNIKLDLGSFFSQFITPVLGEVKDALRPLQPILDVLTARLPVFSDIGPLRDQVDVNHDGIVTLLDLGELFGAPDIGFLNAFVQLANLIREIPTPAPGQNLMIDLGDFDLGALDVRQVGDLKGATPHVVHDVGDPANQLTGSAFADAAKTFFQDAAAVTTDKT